MHILLIHQAFVSPHEAGGTRHYEFARHCANHGHDFSIVASDVSYLSGEGNDGKRRLVSKEKLDKVKILRAFTYPSLHRSFAWRIVSFMSFMVTSVLAGLKAGPIDVVMGTSPPIFQALSAWLVAIIRRRPFLLEIRDLWPEFAIDIGVLRNPILIKLSRWLEQFLYAQATHILINSPAYRDYLLRKGIVSKKITLIPNGVDVTMFDGSTRGERFRQQWHLDGSFVITYAGALGLANDIPTILRAAQRVKTSSNIRFLIVGDGKERPNLEALANRLHLENVLFAGSRPKVDMPEILAASDVCIATLTDVPMFKTTYPNKVFDYMAAGRPTVLGIDGVIRQVIEAAGGGIFVPPGDDQSLANAVQSLEKDRAKAKAMGVAARNYVVKHFDRQQQSKHFMKLIHNLVQ
jgi:glycosyltransferase involved in cell wall biosynthesis